MRRLFQKNFMRKTKIICTYGPSIASEEMIEKVVLAGANVIRFNFSHGDYDYHTKGMSTVKAVRERLDLPVAILLDTKGPEIRTRDQEEELFQLVEGECIQLSTVAEKSSGDVLAVDYANLANEVEVGTDILIDDGRCCVKVIAKEGSHGLKCKVIAGGDIKQRRGVNIPNVDIALPFLSEKDKNDLAFGAKMGVDLVAASFTRTAEDVRDMRRHLFQQDHFTCDIIAKIENRQGVNNIEDISSVADGIMVARGDLGVELPVEEVPHIQKKIIHGCRKFGKPVITATQMLESMITNFQPTRAEVSDVANAIYDTTSAIMLSGETAAGKYPVRCVEMMSTIAKRTESDIDYEKLVIENMPHTSEGTKAMANAALTTAYDMKASAIVSLTSSGYSARLISRIRPGMEIIAATDTQRTFYKMALYWGVKPMMIEIDKGSNLDDVFDGVTKLIEDKAFLPKGSLVVQTGGSPVGVSGSTNVLRTSSIGNVATRGRITCEGTVQGSVHIFKNKNTTPEDRILVMNYLVESDLSVLKRAKGLILQSDRGEDFARVAGETLNIPVIVRAERATSALYENEIIFLDGNEGVVYRNPGQKES